MGKEEAWQAKGQGRALFGWTAEEPEGREKSLAQRREPREVRERGDMRLAQAASLV